MIQTRKENFHLNRHKTRTKKIKKGKIPRSSLEREEGLEIKRRRKEARVHGDRRVELDQHRRKYTYPKA